MSQIYLREVDNRFTEVVDGVIRRGALRAGQQVLDLGTGTGSVAVKAASLVGPRGHLTALDISPEMLGIARRRAAGLGLSNITFLEGRAEEIPVHSGRFDAVLASLSLMYVIDRATAAREIARVLGPGGRLVAVVWSGPEQADIILFQQNRRQLCAIAAGAGCRSRNTLGSCGISGSARARRYSSIGRIRDDRVRLR
jgi:ubiquinone/menaquinone biosynthesis C-methylase UbiE